MTPSTPKTYIHMARDAPVGVVLYRRSHLTTYVLKLDHKDRLIAGSRFYGRLFPERCDISPDGKLFVYFAMRGKRTNGSSDPATWTAVAEPPNLKALVFCPNGSTWGGGGMFLRDHRFALFDTPPDGTDIIRGYRVVHNSKELPKAETAAIMARFRPPSPLDIKGPRNSRRNPHIVRHLKPHVASGYDMFDYVLRHPDGSDVEGAEDIILANWAGWHCDGRLLVAKVRHIHIYEVKPGRKLGRPQKILDLEAAIASRD